MSTSKKGVAIFLASVCGIVCAQTIDELSDLNRQAMLAEARAKLEKKKEAPAAAPGGPFAPASVPSVGSTVAPPAVVSSRPPAQRRSEKSPAPGLVAIYGVGGSLITELTDSGFESKYREGGRTPSGWTVSKIERRQVTMTRPQGKGSGIESVTVPFGVKLDEPKEKEKETASSAATGYTMPPLPSSFPALMK